MNRTYQMKVEYMVKACYQCEAGSVAQAMMTMEGMLADDIAMEHKAETFVTKEADYQLYVLDESKETAA